MSFKLIMNVYDLINLFYVHTFYDFLCTISKVCFRCYGNASVYGRRLCALWSLSFHYLGHEYYVSQFLQASFIVCFIKQNSLRNIYIIKYYICIYMYTIYLFIYISPLYTYISLNIIERLNVF